jgi:putative addiction module antidote
VKPFCNHLPNSEWLKSECSLCSKSINGKLTEGFMPSVKVTTVGNSTGIVLPNEVLEQLHIAEGDVLSVTTTPRGILLTPCRADFAAAIEAGAEVMRQYPKTLKNLAE